MEKTPKSREVKDTPQGHTAGFWQDNAKRRFVWGCFLKTKKKINTNDAKLYSYFKKVNLFIYLCLAALGLRCCVQAFSGCGERGLLFVVV